ncbi:MAG: type II toxin-antitoxin system HipA family toxin [Acidobacteriota bacterium]
MVGRLAERERRIYFEYDEAFLRDPLWLSPFKLAPEPGLIEHRDRDFGPVFGLFDDSLPDGWGLLLIDRFLRRRGSALAELSVLDRLAFLGTRTMGALTYHPPTEPVERDDRVLDLQAMARASEEVLEGSADEVLPRLVRAGGSPGGARPKVLVGVGPDETLLSGETDLPAGYRHWMAKFRGRDDPSDTGPLELAYAHMAADAGITMPPTRLFTAGGDRYFGVERFDRRGNRRHHVHTFGNLIHADFRVPSADYHQLLHVTRVLTRDHRDVVECFRRMVFNVLAHNRDDHVKNFAFRLDGSEWRLAPAYDLIFSRGPCGEHTMTVDGEGRAPARRHLLEVAARAGIDRADTILDEVATAVERWPEHAEAVEVREETQTAVYKALVENLERSQTST